ncbi:tRNA-dihydrouridine synthase [Neurospora intermedia]|uniref:tRNA-dihydrouridine(47) synthase [NAD(P)(+)] n=1 Tax=Neurospora intermedia TaxID=5142 RepID=A0ABR3D8M9_NEUIN
MESQETAKRPIEPNGAVAAQDAEPATKRVKLDDARVPQVQEEPSQPQPQPQAQPQTEDEKPTEQRQDDRDKRRGIAPIRKEYLVVPPSQVAKTAEVVDDDAAEGRTAPGAEGAAGKDGKKKRPKGQNKEREFGIFADAQRLCNSVAWTPEFSPRHCKHGERCNALHDIRKYLKEGRRPDLNVFGGKCPVWETHGKCSSGWRCLFVESHMKEIEHEDGRKELVLTEDPTKIKPEAASSVPPEEESMDARAGVYNVVAPAVKLALSRKKIQHEKSDQYLKWMAKDSELARIHYHKQKDDDDVAKDYAAQYVEPPLKPSEKRRIYFGRETPVLAPLTTQGNLPFRRLCVELGAEITYSEMALGLPLLQGQKADWTLMRAHESEITPPRYTPTGIVDPAYDNSKDLKFGVQITAHAPWIAIKSAETLARYLPHLRVIDLNCGCPIDMVYKSGAGSALLDAPSKLERMIRGMNTVSGDVPVTAKIRMGVRDNHLTAQKLVERLALGAPDIRAVSGAPGCAAITLHGRTRQQRYTKAADWSYIAECAALVKSFNEKADSLQDTIREADERSLPNGGRMYFVGNGDCYSHVDYFNHVDNAKVDSVMVGRGAIIKPWIFEEISAGQYLDKSATERLAYVEKFAKYGMEAWGSDELGLNYTRRFLLEFLSFFHRYVPIGLLEYLPPAMNDRPPAYKGRNELETLLASKNYLDWIKISEMFLGPAPPNFKFQPKHKSNAYENIEAEG